jgi:transposase InsO family protein
MVATRESAALAEKLITATCANQGITRGELSIHADRGSSMTSKPVALLLADLGVTQSHSRPHVSNDNPYSEAQFKTLKRHVRSRLRPLGGILGVSPEPVTQASLYFTVFEGCSAPRVKVRVALPVAPGLPRPAGWVPMRTVSSLSL